MPFEIIGPYRIGFYSEDVRSGEPPHIHVMRDDKELKIWLNDYNKGFKASEERKIKKVLEKYQTHFLTKWETYRDQI